MSSLVAGVVLIGCLVLPEARAAEPPLQPATTPREVGERIIENLLDRDFMYYGDEALHYAEAAAAVGALRFAARAGNTDSRRELAARYALLLEPDSGLTSQREHVDMAVLGILPLEIAMQTGDERMRTLGLGFADRQWANVLPEGVTAQSRWWIDDLYMVGMLQVQAYRATGEMRYAEHAAAELAAYLPRLQQDNGLFHHGPDAPVYWGRGNGWVAVAMAEVLRSLPVEHPQQPEVARRYRQMMSALLGFQGDDGMWRQVVDYPDAWAESSATAMFAYAMAVGLGAGLLGSDEYRPAVRRAWAALVARLDPDGNLRDVCVGTGKENDLAYYLERPRVDGDLHGQAPMLWLATELLPGATP